MQDLINIQNEDGQMVVSSREVAENFGKRHADILRDIENLLKNDSTQNCVQYFIQSEYKDASGKVNKEYMLPRDGFSLLVMGFTGKEALKWKLKYIEAFNKMEEILFEQPETLSFPTKRQAFEDNIAVAKECIKLFGADPGLAYSVAMNEAEKDSGCSLAGFKTLLPDAKEEKGTLNATMVGKKLGHISPRLANKMLEEAGLQEKVNGEWKATDKGLDYCTMTPYTNNGHSSYRPLWKENVTSVLSSF